MNPSRRIAGLRWFTLVAWVMAAFLPVARASAQVTTGSINGVVMNGTSPVSGASIIAIHEPSGTTYETTTRADGKFVILNMRVGGPYSVQAVYVGSGNAFAPKTIENITVNLGASADVPLNVQAISVAENVTVTADTDPVFSSARTGAATQVSRDDIKNLPTISGRISDLTRLTPQSSGNAFAGQDNRLNNITVDGAAFNSSFGLGEGQPGGRTGVAPISLESIEQVQVSVAPFDVRQGGFVGAAVNTVTRSGTNRFTGSYYHRLRNQSLVGTEAKGLTVNPGTFTFRDDGVWASGPVVRNKLFVFGNYENEKASAPLSTFVANTGGQPVGGSITRVLASDLDTLSAYLKQNFKYDTGGYQNLNADTPAKRYMLRGDYNLNNSNKISVRYNQLDSSAAKVLSGSTSVGRGRSILSTNFLNFASSNYAQLENFKSGVGEWNSVLGRTMSQNLILGYTTNNENRTDIQLFPFVDILAPDGTAYTSIGAEPFTPNNELLFHTTQLQENFTKFGVNHSLTFGGALQRYESDNSFFNCCKQTASVYNSLQDFYTDANDYLANPNRTTSPVTLNRFQMRWMNIPGLDKPLQVLKVLSGGAWAQDEWRPSRTLTITGGIRIDSSSFGKTKTYPNPNADALAFRDETGAAVSYLSGKLPSAKLLWSPRVGFNLDVLGTQTTQLRGGTGIFTGPPLYVWVSNQLGNTGVLQGSLVEDGVTTRPFNPDPLHYRPTNVTGAPASSYELDVTDNKFKFPQIWRNNIALDQRLPGGITSTTEFIYNRDVNGIYYINANLPAAQSTFAGPDNRPRWTGVACGSGTAGSCINRINNAVGNQVTGAIVMKNESIGRSWNISQTLAKTYKGLILKGAYSYGDAKNTIDPGSTAASSFGLNPISRDPNNPGLARAASAQGHRVFVQTAYSRSYFGFGATTIAAFWDAHPTINGTGFATNVGYVYASDMNGDGGSGNDLIYIPRDTSEMNFTNIPATATNRAFTAAEETAAFEAYIKQDKYLSKHRGEYAKRGAIWYPMVKRMDLSLTQDVFRNIGGKRNAGQFRVDITNFGNLLNHNWGVGQRTVASITQGNGAQILTNPGVDAQGQPTYRMALASGQLVNTTFQPNTFLQSDVRGSDVYQLMLSFRYQFN